MLNLIDHKPFTMEHLKTNSRRQGESLQTQIVNRICAETQCLIGFFVKTVVLDSFDSPTMRRMGGPFPHAARRDYCEP